MILDKVSPTVRSQHYGHAKRFFILGLLGYLLLLAFVSFPPRSVDAWRFFLANANYREITVIIGLSFILGCVFLGLWSYLLSFREGEHEKRNKGMVYLLGFGLLLLYLSSGFELAVSLLARWK